VVSEISESVTAAGVPFRSPAVADGLATGRVRVEVGDAVGVGVELRVGVAVGVGVPVGVGGELGVGSAGDMASLSTGGVAKGLVSCRAAAAITGAVADRPGVLIADTAASPADAGAQKTDAAAPTASDMAIADEKAESGL
jgi:hypothetical protein